MWKKTRRAMAGYRASDPARGLVQALDRLAEPGFVALGERHQQLLYAVGALGGPQVQLTAILHLVLELCDPLTKRVPPLVPQPGAEPAEVVCRLLAPHAQPRLHRCHSTTSRPIRCPTVPSGLCSLLLRRNTIVAPRPSSSSTTVRINNRCRWLRLANGASWPRSSKNSR